MRIAVVNHAGDRGAGAEHALLQFLVRLPAGIEPVLFFFEDGAFAQSVRERFGAHNVTIVPMSARVANAQRGGLRLDAITDSLDLVRRLTRALRAAQPDLVLTNSMKAHIVGSIAAKLAGLRCVNYVHDIVSGPALWLLRTVSGTCAVERMTCSGAVAASLGLDRTTAVYAPIETAHFAALPARGAARRALGIPDDGLPVVALVGRIARWKGQDRFVRIARRVLRDTDAHFIIVGSPIFGCDPAYVPELEAAVAAYGLHERVHFVPWQDDMRAVYAAVDVACNCSTREPFGRTSLEAFAAGIPVVCFSDAGICEIFAPGEGGMQIPVGEESAFARAVRAYLREPQLIADAKRAALRVAEPHDIANVYRTFADVLSRVAAPRMTSPGTVVTQP